MLFKRLVGVTLGLLLLFGCASAALADNVDPNMQADDPINCAGATGGICVVLTGNLFTFTANSQGGGVFGFRNGLSVGLTSLLIQENGFPASQVGCDPAVNGVDPNTGNIYAFTSCVVTNTGSGVTDIFFSNPITPGGVLPGHEFFIDLNPASQGVGFWQPNETFQGTLNAPAPIPEPSTLLMLSGGALLAWKRRRHL